MLVFGLKISFFLIYIVYRNYSIWRLGRSFTFGRQQEGAYLKQGEEPGKRLVSSGKSKLRDLHPEVHVALFV